MSAHVSEINVTRKRGDTFPIAYVLNDEEGVPIDITGFSFLMTVDPSPDPVNATNNLFQLIGQITDGVNGQFEFRPSAGEMDQDPDTYFYDVQMTDLGGFIRTIIVGQFVIEQDITK